MDKKIKIVVAEHSQLFRKSLISLLKTRSEFEIVGEANDGKELLTQLKQKKPDIALLDVEMPVMDGKTTLEVIRMRFPNIKVIVLSNHSSHNRTTDFMSRGARCYLTIKCEVETLFDAIFAVNREGYYFDNSISKAILGALIKGKTTGESLHDASFSYRETEIMRAICDGKTNREIAISLHLSKSSIDFYKSRIYEKANCSNVVMLFKYALKKGIVVLD